MVGRDRELAERPERSASVDGVAPLRYGPPTGEPCPRTVRFDGGVDGTGDCLGCGTCLLGTGLV